MTIYTIQTTQSFDVTYRVEADSPEEAFDALRLGESLGCDDQSPGEIIASFEESHIEEDA